MKMTSLEFKKLQLEFSDDLKEIEEQLDAAVEGELEQPQIASAIDAGKSKVATYDRLIKDLEGQKRQDMVDDYGNDVEEIRRLILTLEKR